MSKSLCSNLRKNYTKNIKRGGNPCAAIMSGTAGIAEGCKWANKAVLKRVKALVLNCNR
jgi:hypothetical protein